MKKLSETYKELGIAFTFPIDIKDANGNRTYYEDSNGFGPNADFFVMAFGFDANTMRKAT